jgi:hypothetical protein
MLIAKPVDGFIPDEAIEGTAFQGKFANGKVLSIAYPSSGYGMIEILPLDDGYDGDIMRFDTFEELRDELVRRSALI